MGDQTRPCQPLPGSPAPFAVSLTPIPQALPAPQSAELPQQVDNLLKAVEATNIFESEMARRFEGAVDREPSSSEDAEVGADGGAATADDSTPASRVRQRYEKLAREKQRTAEGESPERRKEQVGGLRWLAGWVVQAPQSRPAASLGDCCCNRPAAAAGARHLGGSGQDQLQGQHFLRLCAIPRVGAREGGLRNAQPATAQPRLS